MAFALKASSSLCSSRLPPGRVQRPCQWHLRPRQAPRQNGRRERHGGLLPADQLRWGYAPGVGGDAPLLTLAPLLALTPFFTLIGGAQTRRQDCPMRWLSSWHTPCFGFGAGRRPNAHRQPSSIDLQGTRPVTKDWVRR